MTKTFAQLDAYFEKSLYKAMEDYHVGVSDF